MKSDVQELRVPALDGYPLSASLFAAGKGASSGLVLVNSATAVKRQYYARYAQFLAASGLSTLTYDYRGIGDSQPAKMRGFHALLREWGELDLAGAISWSETRFPGLRLLVVGHSVGGQILGLAPNNDRIHAVLGVASQHGHWRQWPVPARYGMMLYWYGLLPATAHLFGYVPRWLGLGESIPKGVALEWARWGRSRHYVLGEGDGARRAGFERLAGSFLSLSFSDDGYAPRQAVEALLALYPNARRTHRHMTPAEAGGAIGHFGFFKERFQETLWAESAAWLRSQAALA